MRCDEIQSMSETYVVLTIFDDVEVPSSSTLRRLWEDTTLEMAVDSIMLNLFEDTLREATEWDMREFSRPSPSMNPETVLEADCNPGERGPATSA